MDKRNVWKIAENVWDIESNTISDLSKTIDREEIISCIEKIARCEGKIVTSGSGTSGTAAKKISHSLSCVERPSFFLTPSDALHGSLGSVSDQDIAILISKGGNTKEIANLIEPLKEKGTYIIGVTETYDSRLGRESDQVLKIKTEKEADNFDMLATSSTLAVIAVFDAICIAIMDISGYTKERFAVIHPEGAVGDRLKKTKDKK